MNPLIHHLLPARLCERTTLIKESVGVVTYFLPFTHEGETDPGADWHCGFANGKSCLRKWWTQFNSQ